MMIIDDPTVPPGIASAIRQASAAMPAQAWDLDGLKARAGGTRGLLRWRWSRRWTGIVAGAAAAIAAGSAAVALGPGFATHEGGQDKPLWVLSADQDHLYAVWSDCGDNGCVTTLVGSDNDGATWSRRTSRAQSFRPSVGPGNAVYAEQFQLDPSGQPGETKSDDSGTAVSTDGGRTWKSVVDNPEPWPALPANAKVVCGQGSTDCALSAIDPASGRESPLPRQPDGGRFRFWFAVGGQLWLDGSGDNVQSTTVSRDGGHTWTTKSQSCPAYCGDDRLAVGLDGKTVYRVRLAGNNGGTVIQRSTDSGATWRSFDAAGTRQGAAGDPSGQTAGIVTPDGNLVAIRFSTAGGAPEAWTLGRLDAQPRPVRLTGLPDNLGHTYGSGLTGNPDTGYLITPVEGDTVYRSLDGLTWWALQIPHP